MFSFTVYYLSFYLIFFLYSIIYFFFLYCRDWWTHNLFCLFHLLTSLSLLFCSYLYNVEFVVISCILFLFLTIWLVIIHFLLLFPLQHLDRSFQRFFFHLTYLRKTIIHILFHLLYHRNIPSLYHRPRLVVPLSSRWYVKPFPISHSKLSLIALNHRKGGLT